MTDDRYVGPDDDRHRYVVAPESFDTPRVGGQGIVFRAERDGDAFAVKLMTGLKTSDFGTVSERVAVFEGVDHPGLLRHAESFLGAAPDLDPDHVAADDLDTVIVVDEWVDGEPLSEAISAADLPTRLEWIRSLADAVDHLHRIETANAPHGLVHRDIKPSNVLIRRDGQAVLIDYGVARPAPEAGDLTSGIGTYGWIAPEVSFGSRNDPLDAKAADRWAVGAVAHYILTGERPTLGSATHTARFLEEHAEQLGAKDPGAMAAHIARLLEEDERSRPSDLGRWARDLVDVRPRRRGRRALAAVAAGLVVVGVLALLDQRPEREEALGARDAASVLDEGPEVANAQLTKLGETGAVEVWHEVGDEGTCIEVRDGSTTVGRFLCDAEPAGGEVGAVVTLDTSEGRFAVGVVDPSVTGVVAPGPDAAVDATDEIEGTVAVDPRDRGVAYFMSVLASPEKESEATPLLVSAGDDLVARIDLPVIADEPWTGQASMSSSDAYGRRWPDYRRAGRIIGAGGGWQEVGFYESTDGVTCVLYRRVLSVADGVITDRCPTGDPADDPLDGTLTASAVGATTSYDLLVVSQAGGTSLTCDRCTEPLLVWFADPENAERVALVESVEDLSPTHEEFSVEVTKDSGLVGRLDLANPAYVAPVTVPEDPDSEPVEYYVYWVDGSPPDPGSLLVCYESGVNTSVDLVFDGATVADFVVPPEGLRFVNLRPGTYAVHSTTTGAPTGVAGDESVPQLGGGFTVTQEPVEVTAGRESTHRCS